MKPMPSNYASPNTIKALGLESANINDGRTLTLGSLSSKSLLISASEGNPPAVTSPARVNVQYVSFAFSVEVIFDEWSL